MTVKTSLQPAGNKGWDRLIGKFLVPLTHTFKMTALLLFLFAWWSTLCVTVSSPLIKCVLMREHVICTFKLYSPLLQIHPCEQSMKWYKFLPSHWCPRRARTRLCTWSVTSQKLEEGYHVLHDATIFLLQNVLLDLLQIGHKNIRQSPELASVHACACIQVPLIVPLEGRVARDLKSWWICINAT